MDNAFLTEKHLIDFRN